MVQSLVEDEAIVLMMSPGWFMQKRKQDKIFTRHLWQSHFRTEERISIQGKTGCKKDKWVIAP